MRTIDFQPRQIFSWQTFLIICRSIFKGILSLRLLAAVVSMLLATCVYANGDTRVAELPGWQSDHIQEAWPAFIKSCTRLQKSAPWTRVCKLAASIDATDANNIRRFFEANFTSRMLTSPDGSPDALVTGYFEPILQGRRTADDVYRFPLYNVPSDLKKGLPYITRKQIDSGEITIPATVIAYLKDDLDRYLAHVQGSCKIELADGKLISVVYAAKNSQPYISIGKILVSRGDVPEEKISMQAIREWASNNPERVNDLLWSNPSYTFFSEREATTDGPPGAMNVGLTPQRSAAIDPEHVPFGYPIWMDTTLPDNGAPYQRLLLSQDKGAAIKGLRVDVYFGTGAAAGEIAGKMKQTSHVWILVPVEVVEPMNVN